MAVDEELTEKQQRFAEEYAKDWNGTQAMLRVNPNQTIESAGVTACRWLKLPKIQQAVRQEKLSNRRKREQRINRRAKNLEDQANSNIFEVIDVNDLTLKRDIPERVQRCVQAIEITRKIISNEEGESVILENIKVKMYDSIAAKKLAMQADGLLSPPDPIEKLINHVKQIDGEIADALEERFLVPIDAQEPADPLLLEAPGQEEQQGDGSESTDREVPGPG